MVIDGDGRPTGDFARRHVSIDPRIERVDGLLTADECKFLIDLSDPRMARATIFHESEGRFVEDPIRRSDKAGFSIVSEWPFVRALNLRIAAATVTAASSQSDSVSAAAATSSYVAVAPTRLADTRSGAPVLARGFREPALRKARASWC